jgi:hypothetical protein
MTEYSQSRIASLSEVVKRIELRYGSNSSQAEQIRNALNKSEQSMSIYVNQLEHAHNLLIELYPPPREWFER